MELEYGKSLTVECNSTASKAQLSWNISNTVFNKLTLEINSTSFVESSGWAGKASCHGRFVGLDDCHKDLNVIIYSKRNFLYCSLFCGVNIFSIACTVY